MLIKFMIFYISGCILLLLLTLIVYKTGLVHKTRDQEGHLKKKQTIFSILIMIIIFLLIIFFFILFQIFSFNNKTNFFEIFSWTFFLMMLLIIFDSIIIDILLIGKIRPSFLNIPNETTIETMKAHVIKTFTIGWIFIIPIILLSSMIAFFILNR